MGYYATGSYSFTFRDEEAILATAAALESDEDDPVERTADEAREVIAKLLARIGEDTETYFDKPEDGDGKCLTINGWSSGRAYLTDWDEFLKCAAPYAEGSGDWMGEEDHPWRDRIFGDGEIKQYEGLIIYPGDPLDDQLEIWKRINKKEEK